jgi:hypothetical protein
LYRTSKKNTRLSFTYYTRENHIDITACEVHTFYDEILTGAMIEPLFIIGEDYEKRLGEALFVGNGRNFPVVVECTGIGCGCGEGAYY